MRQRRFLAVFDLAQWTDKLAKVVYSGQVLLGELQPMYGRALPLKLEFASFDTSSGRIVGQLAWGVKQYAINRIEGTLYGGTTLIFEETAVIKHGRDKLGTIYTVRLSQDGRKIEGKWSIENSHGVLWFRLE